MGNRSPEPPAQEGDGSAVQPLDDLTVVDLSRALAGPYCTVMVAALGARVIKVETPNHGDELRIWGKTMPTTEGAELATWWFRQARNKRLITLDFRKADGQRLAVDVVEAIAIVIENFGHGGMEGLGSGLSVSEVANP